MIFPTIWRLLPGPLAVRVVLFVSIIAGLVWGLFVFVFPWVAESLLPTPDAAVETDVSPVP